MKQFFAAMMLVCVFACAVFAQQSQVASNNNSKNGGGNPSSSSSSTATSASGASASTGASSSNLTFNGSSDSRQLIQTIPGSTTPGPLPGSSLGEYNWSPYRAKTVSTYGQRHVHTKNYKPTKPQCDFDADAKKAPDEDARKRIIHLLNWWPPAEGPVVDIVGQCKIMSNPEAPDGAVVAQLLLVLEKETGSDACAVRYRPSPIVETDASSKGIGGGFSRMFSGDNNGGAVSVGYASGKSKVGPQTRIEAEAVCVDIKPYGSYEWSAAQPPAPPPQPQPEPSPDVSSAPAPPTNLRAEVRATPTTPVPLPASKQEAKPEPAVEQDPCADLSSIRFSVKWAIDRPTKEDAIPGKPYKPKASDFWTDPKGRDAGSKSLDVWLADIKGAADWLNGHPGCKVQSVGHASAEASDRYNVLLGDRRGWAIDYLLRQNGLTAENLKQWVSLGKRQLVRGSEYNSNSRYVDLEAIGPETGP